MTESHAAEHLDKDTVERLRSIVSRIERLEEERKALGSDIRDIFAEAKSAGFDVAALKQVIKERSKSPEEVQAHESMVELYRERI